MRSHVRTWLAITAVIAVAFGLGLALAPVQRDAPLLTPLESSRPDPEVFAVALSALEQYHASSSTATAWVLSADTRAGTIQSTWYSVHKGEIWFKVQVSVWGQLYRVDVYERVGFFPPQRATKTERSAQLEWALQKRISKLLETAKRK